MRDKVVFTGLERGWREDVGVTTEIDTAEERALLADGGKFLFLGRSLHEDCRIVAKDSSQDL